MLHLLHSHDMSHPGPIGEPFDPLQHHRPRSYAEQYTLPLPPIQTTTPSSSSSSTAVRAPASAAPASASASILTPTGSASGSFWSRGNPLTPPVEIKRPMTTTTTTTIDMTLPGQQLSRVPHVSRSSSITANQASVPASSLYRPVLQPNINGSAYYGNEPLRVSTGRSPRRSSVSTQHHRRSSGEDVTPGLRVPKSIKTPVIDLSQLVAEIACLFWFESHTLLQQIHNAPYLSRPLPQLSPDAVPSAGFKKWVTTVLSTTQVAQNVILLALLFIYRLKKLNPTVKGKAGSEYRLLTVALMLGNKFLDDNTYTNKTWAEVSGITVQEIHIMEVEFLSNMRYSLFTGELDWKEWHAKLGRFSSYVYMVMHPVADTSPKNTLHAPTLPSPPSSNNASPPFNYVHSPSTMPQIPAGSFNLRPTSMHVSPMGPSPDLDYRNYPRKRSHDDDIYEQPSKRASWQPQPHSQPQPQSQPLITPRNMIPPAASNALPRYHLPSLSNFTPQNYKNSSNALMNQAPPQLPLPTARTQSLAYPAPPPPMQWSQSSSASSTTSAAPVRPKLQIHGLSMQPDFSRQGSPYHAESVTSSPVGNSYPPSSSQQIFTQSQPQSQSSQPQSFSQPQPPSRRSPSYFLEQRNSPYRPVRGVTTLLVPPPAASTLQNAPQHVALEQMQYQPLGRPFHERRQGPVPYLHREAWPDSHQFNQWPAPLPQHVTQR